MTSANDHCELLESLRKDVYCVLLTSRKGMTFWELKKHFFHLCNYSLENCLSELGLTTLNQFLHLLPYVYQTEVIRKVKEFDESAGGLIDVDKLVKVCMLKQLPGWKNIQNNLEQNEILDKVIESRRLKKLQEQKNIRTNVYVKFEKQLILLKCFLLKMMEEYLQMDDETMNYNFANRLKQLDYDQLKLFYSTYFLPKFDDPEEFTSLHLTIDDLAELHKKYFEEDFFRSFPSYRINIEHLSMFTAVNEVKSTDKLNFIEEEIDEGMDESLSENSQLEIPEMKMKFVYDKSKNFFSIIDDLIETFELLIDDEIRIVDIPKKISFSDYRELEEKMLLVGFSCIKDLLIAFPNRFSLIEDINDDDVQNKFQMVKLVN
ncbi:hypothetical protein SNEBB_000607 [Seison nebaliae]|nr:hypothetical protein SNEBB_000607 [Seison nebaliae]